MTAVRGADFAMTTEFKGMTFGKSEARKIYPALPTLM